MNSKFKYAAGLPGYGVNGNDGSSGLSGFSIFLTDLLVEEGANLTITSKIERNEGLFSYDTTSIPGYPLRQYQNDDIFVDGNSKVYIIDFTNINKFVYSGISFGAGEFLKRITTSNLIGGYFRYANVQMSERKLIDTVMGPNTNYYSTPNDIYGIGPRDFAQINFVSSALAGHNPYVLFNTASSTQDDAIALVRNTTTGMWRLGNLNSANGYPRNTSITFDFSRMLKNVNNKTYDMLTKYDLDASILFSPQFDTVPSAFVFSQDGSTVSVSWNSKQILAVANDDAVNANLVVFPVKTYNGQTFSYDVSSGAMYDVTSKNFSKSHNVVRINSSGSMSITGLDPNVEYASYIEYDMNGWVRRTAKRAGSTAFKYIKLDPDYLTSPANGSSRTVAVTSNVSWTVTSRSSWINVSPTSGTSTTMTLIMDANVVDGPARFGYVTLSGGGINRTINVRQNSFAEEEDVYYDTNWQSMERGSAADSGWNFAIRFRRYGKVVVINGLFRVKSGAPQGSEIAKIPYSSIGGGTSGPKGVSIWFGGNDAYTSSTDVNRGIRGYIPAYAEGQESLRLILDKAYQNGEIALSITYICD